jgi:hypothetical protein
VRNKLEIAKAASNKKINAYNGILFSKAEAKTLAL